MYDRFNRNITYLRVSVTDRCNLHCIYCMPEGEAQLLKRNELLSFEEITEIVKTGVRLGIRKVRLTGGEPLIRKGIVKLVSMIAAIKDIEEVSMTTNGNLLTQFAAGLKAAGLARVNVSLDSVSPDQYKSISGGGDIQKVFEGIRAACNAGLTPVKINVVKLNDDIVQDFKEIKRFAELEKLQVRFINQMDLTTGSFSQVEGGEGGNCPVCNRLRVTANGNIKPCLFSEKSFSIRELGAERAFLMAIQAKPWKGTINNNGRFYNIGG